MAKIILVNPVTRKRNKVLRVERCQQKALASTGIWPPINLLEIAAHLKHRGFDEIEITDGEIEGLSQDRLSRNIAKNNPGLIALQVTTPTIEDDLSFAALLKRYVPKTSIILTGIHPTIFAKDLLREKAVDYVALGEPEEIVSDLADYLFRHKGELKEIKGLGYKDGGGVNVNSRRTQRENYDYPILPDRSLLKNERYIMPLTGKPFTVIKVSRGCNFNCSFCTSLAYYGRGWRSRSPKNIVAEIKDAKDKFGIDTFLFLADTFNGDINFVKELACLIISERLNIKWASNSRLDLIDEESAQLMRRSGCMLVSLGIESYDAKLLKRSRKCLAVEDIERGIAILQKQGIKTYGYFIFGLEGENKKSIIKTLFKAAASGLNFAHFYSLTPYPGTEYFRKYGSLKPQGYYHGVSDILTHAGMNKLFIKTSRYLAFLLFYGRPDRLSTLIRYLIRGNLAC